MPGKLAPLISFKQHSQYVMSQEPNMHQQVPSSQPALHAAVLHCAVCAVQTEYSTSGLVQEAAQYHPVNQVVKHWQNSGLTYWPLCRSMNSQHRICEAGEQLQHLQRPESLLILQTHMPPFVLWRKGLTKPAQVKAGETAMPLLLPL